jgi:hypothetical protein
MTDSIDQEDREHRLQNGFRRGVAKERAEFAGTTRVEGKVNVGEHEREREDETQRSLTGPALPQSHSH